MVDRLANKILTTEFYHDEIRGRLGVGEDVISNADIDAPSVLSIGELRIISAVPDYDTLQDDDKTYLYAATVTMVAAILAPSMSARFKKAKKDFDFSYENQVINWQKVSIELIDEAYGYIDLISTVGIGDNAPIIGLAGPTRLKEMRN